MRNKRTICVSDVHGCFTEFCMLLDKCGYSEKDDKLVLLGDYIDRGLQSKEVFEKIINLQKNGDVVVLRGNHEQMALDYWKYGDMTFSYNGGANTLISFDNDLEDFVKWVQKLPFIYTDDDYYFVHAGMDLSKSEYEKQDVDDLIWIRESFVDVDSNYKKKIVHGHTPTSYVRNNPMFKEPTFDGGKINIDTGGVFGGKFTALIIDKDNNVTYEQVEGFKK